MKPSLRRGILVGVCLGLQLGTLFNLIVEYVRFLILLWEIDNHDRTN
jgi:hypothetical protein